MSSPPAPRAPQHSPTCRREILRHADDSAAYLSEPCSCGAAPRAPLDLELIRDTAKADDVYALACTLLPALRIVARAKGYALAYHGSFARDIDLIAAPWLDSAADALELAEAIRVEAERVSGHMAFVINDDDAAPCNYLRRAPEPKPHGRLGWSIHLAGTGTYLDLSVLDAGSAHLDAKLAEFQRKLDASYAETIKQSKRAQAAEDALASLSASRQEQFDESRSPDGDGLPMRKGLGDGRGVDQPRSAEMANVSDLSPQSGREDARDGRHEKSARLKPAAGSEPADSHTTLRASLSASQEPDQ